MAVLDAGQLVNIAGLSNQPLRDYLENLFALLRPSCLQHSPGDGWYKVEGVKSVSGWILHRMLGTGAVVQPSALSTAQQLACRVAPVTLLDALAQHPGLAHDVAPLLGGVARGGAVRLGGVRDVGVRARVAELLQALGARPGEDDEDEDDSEAEDPAWAIPEGPRGEGVAAALTSFAAAVAAGNAISNSSSSSSSNINSSSSSSSSRAAQPHSDHSSSSDDDDDDDNDGHNVGDEDDEVGPPHVDPRVGPLRPSAAQLAAAAVLAAAQEELEDDDDDDEVGPLPRQRHAAASVSASALYGGAGGGPGAAIRVGATGVTMSTLGGDVPLGVISSSSSSDAAVADGELVREEWMVDPGEDRVLGFETFGVSRKFQTGKKAKVKNAMLAEEREALEKAMEGSAEAIRTKEVLEAYRELRGASLMDRHVEEAARKKTTSRPVPVERRAFDRELDVVGRRSMGQHQVEQLVQHAKELDSRFDKGSVQRSFL